VVVADCGRQPILGAIGTPIEVPKVENPSQEDIDKFHALFVERLVALFDKYKAAYGWPDKKLIIK
jgi:diacylglycerol O-acyltransferase 2